MDSTPDKSSVPPSDAARPVSERVVYMVPADTLQETVNHSDEIDLRALWKEIWAGRRIVIGVTALFAAASVTYALVATEWFRAEIVLVPSRQGNTPSLGSQLGGLASLAGISVGAGGASVEPVAVLSSREFAGEFIKDLNLMPVLLADQWDPELKAWETGRDGIAPDLRDATKLFVESIRNVEEDKRTGLVTLSIEWKDPKLAAGWAQEFVRRLNEKMRLRAEREAESNVTYLRAELAATVEVTLQQSIGRLLEAEMQKAMLARGNAEYAFRVVDSPEPPKERSRPKRTQVVLATTIVGALFSVAMLLVWRRNN